MREPRMGQEVVIDEIVDVEGYRLPELSNIGNVRYERIQPADPAPRALDGSNEVNLTLYKKDWIARSAGDIGAYFEFEISQIRITPGQNPPAAAAIKIEPYAVFSEIDLQINGESVLPVTNQFPAIYASWLARQDTDWLATHGDQLGLVGLNGAALVHPLFARPQIAGAADSDESPSVKFIMPLPPMGPLNNPFHALPVGHLDRVTLRCVLNKQTNFCSLAANNAELEANTTVRIKNLYLHVPYFSVDPRTDAAVSKRLSEAMFDPTRAIVLDTLTTSVLTQDLLDNTGDQNFTFYPNRQFAEGLEAVFHPSTAVATSGWRAGSSVTSGIDSYWFKIDGNPTSVYKNYTATRIPYERFLDHVAASNKICGESYKVNTAVFKRMFDTVNGLAGAADTFVYFAAVSPLTVPGAEGLDASRDMNSIQLEVSKTAVAGTTMPVKIIMMVHGRTRLLLTKNSIAVKH